MQGGNMTEKVIKGYKGFNKDMTCRGFQYAVGKDYETGQAIICESGFHACENPHEVFSYYSAGESKFCEVEQSGEIQKHDDDSKVVSTKININTEISVFNICKIAVQSFFDRFEFTKKIKSTETNNAGYKGAANAGNYGAANAGDRGAANAGDRGAANAGDRGAANAGDCGAANAGYKGAANAGYKGAANAGDRGAASVGKKGVAIVSNGKAKGDIGALLVLCERDDEYNVVHHKACVVDGKNIKANTWYELKNKKFVKVKP
jgi:hypothetical protein